MRATPWVVLVTLVLSACSGDDGSAEAPEPTLGVSAVTTPEGADDRPAPAPSTTSAQRDLRRVAVTIESAQLDVQTQLSGVAGGDPFGDFATCSGLARQVGSYAVGVGDADGSVRWVSAVTAQRIDGPGSYDADIRVEFAAGETIDAIGSLTLDEGLASGAFVASTPAGELVTGRFTCEGATTPALVGGDAAAGLVEVVALLQLDGAERVVSVASNDPADVECPLGAGGAPLLVRIDGDPSIGTIGWLELRADTADAGSLSLRVGGRDYEFADVAIELTAEAGIFAATPVAGPAVDGAFSCSS